MSRASSSRTAETATTGRSAPNSTTWAIAARTSSRRSAQSTTTTSQEPRRRAPLKPRGVATRTQLAAKPARANAAATSSASRADPPTTMMRSVPAAPGATRSCDARRGRLADARERAERRASAGWSLRFESATSPTLRLVVMNRAYDKPYEVILIYTDERSGPMSGMEFTHGRTIVARLPYGADLLDEIVTLADRHGIE